jgi:cerevisin
MELHSLVADPDPANIGLGRISHRNIDFSSYVHDNTNGTGTCGYILDSGVFPVPGELEGRVMPGANGVPLEPFQDLNGHETHVAGIFASKSYGVATNSIVIDVKITDRKGRLLVNNLLSGLNFVLRDYILPERRVQCRNGMIVNISVGFNVARLTDLIDATAVAGLDLIIDTIIRNSNLLFFISSGNDAQDAEFNAPGHLDSSCTIGNLNEVTDQIFTGPGGSSFGQVYGVSVET